MLPRAPLITPPKIPAAYRKRLVSAVTGKGFAPAVAWAAPKVGPMIASATGAPPPSAGGPSSTATPDWTTDPVYQQILASGTRRISDAEAAALAARKQELIGLGYDPALQSLYPDASTAAAAKQNPFSTFSTLAQAYALNQKSLNEGLNQQNLFFSGYRGQQLQLQGQDYLRQQASATQTARSALAQIANQLLAARQAAEDAKIAAAQDAYGRWVASRMPAGVAA